MKKIIHIDMDCFYAAVEMRDFPQYKNVPLAVGGVGARSVLSTCNYQARKYGIRSAMSSIKALQLCPNLVIVNGRMAVYQQVSQHIRNIFKQYTDIIEPLSLDEAYLDVSYSPLCGGSATLIAEKIRQQIFDELNLTASAGIAPNKFLAKIASDENKPNGQCVVSPDKVAMFVEHLPLKKIPGIGPKTAKKLQARGYSTCKDVRESNVTQLQLVVGKFASALYQRAFGEDERALEISRQRKSLAIETTFSEDIEFNHQVNNHCQDVIDELFVKLLKRMENHGDRSIVRQGVKLKFSDFNQTTVEQQSLSCDKESFTLLLEKALTRAGERSIRLIGLTLGFEEISAAPLADKQLTLPFELSPIN